MDWRHVLLGLLCGLGATAAQAERVTCESIGDRWAECPLRGREIRIVQQISDSPCIEGYSYGRTSRGVYVDEGCRAVFESYGERSSYGYGNGPRITCESIDERRRECSSGAGEVRLLRQFSNAPCIEGRTWGRSPYGIWVDEGCRGEFELRPRREQGHGGWGRADRVLCESHDERYEECPTGPGEVRLLRQLSNSDCVAGRNWGRSAQGIWVNDGCRAVFAVGGHGGHGGFGTPARRLTCESYDGRWEECSTGGGRVRLVEQLSKTPCIENRTWGRTARGVYVNDGCRAEFEIVGGY